MTNNDDPHRRPLPDPPLPEDEAFGLFMKAVDEIYYTLRVVQSSARHAGFTMGVNAYREWMGEELKKFQAASTAAPEKMTMVEMSARAPIGAAILAEDIRQISETAKNRVFLSIKARPGRRGVEIANEFATATPPLLERTVRTALFRLKGDGDIVAVENRWYATDAAPIRRQPDLMGGPDGPA
jgi:hypothetical protein